MKSYFWKSTTNTIVLSLWYELSLLSVQHETLIALIYLYLRPIPLDSIDTHQWLVWKISYNLWFNLMKFDKHIFWLRLMHNTERLKEDELIEHNVQNGVSTTFVWWSMMSEQRVHHIFSNFIFTFITGYTDHVKDTFYSSQLIT